MSSSAVARLSRRAIDAGRNLVEFDAVTYMAFHRQRSSRDFVRAYEASEPLVTVCVGTYNRAILLTERCLPSILSQTYPNIEVIVVGDACDDDTAQKVADLGDDRIYFENLPVRGPYPEDPRHRWMVAGTNPVNRALQLANGDFITHLDDDDRYDIRRIELLLEFVVRERLEFAWHPFHAELPNGSWELRRCQRFQYGEVTTSSSFYHRWLAAVPWDPQAYLLEEPGDWNRFRKMRALGVRRGRYPEPLLWHHLERQQGIDA